MLVYQEIERPWRKHLGARMNQQQIKPNTVHPSGPTDTMYTILTHCHLYVKWLYLQTFSLISFHNTECLLKCAEPIILLLVQKKIGINWHKCFKSQVLFNTSAHNKLLLLLE